MRSVWGLNNKKGPLARPSDFDGINYPISLSACCGVWFA